MPQTSLFQLFQELKWLKVQEKVSQDFTLAPTLQSDSGCSQTSLNLSLSACFLKTAEGFNAGLSVLRQIRPLPRFSP